MDFDEKRVKHDCANGQIPELMEYLRAFPEQEELLQRYERIFLQNPPVFEYPTDQPMLRKILNVYYQYYVYVFGQKHTPAEGDQFLQEEFQRVFSFRRPHQIDATELRIKWLVAREGYYFLGGTTSVFRGPYIWKTTEKTVYTVEIPTGTVKVPVFFMKDFLSNSWLSFLTFGKTGTGGWTKRNGLYCRWEDYQDRLEHPSFVISFLKHEAQHLHDFRHFGRKIPNPVLEYRAKLCELSYYPDSTLFEKFLETAKNDERYAHSMAEYWVVSDLSEAIFHQGYVAEVEAWRGVYAQVPEISRRLLKNHHRLKTLK